MTYYKLNFCTKLLEGIVSYKSNTNVFIVALVLHMQYAIVQLIYIMYMF